MSNEEILENIRALCKKEGIGLTTLEKEMGWGRGSIGKIKNAKRKPALDKLQKIAERFGVSVSEIAGDDLANPHRKNIIRVYSPEEQERNRSKLANLFALDTGLRYSKRIPVLGRVAAGIPIEAQQEVLDWEEVTGEMALSGEYFCLRIDGDSMEPKFSKGDVIIVRQQDTAEDGNYVVALVNGSDAVCKRLKKYEDGIALVSTNPAYAPMYFTAQEIETRPVRILGVVKELRAKF